MKTFLKLKTSTMLALGVITLCASYHAMAFDTDELKDGQSAYSSEFDQLDKDQSGVINWTETKADKSLTHKAFVAADKDKDGTLDKEEYAEAKTKMGQQKISRVADDSWITTKAKTELLREKDLKSFNIDVKTYKGDVILSGFVDNELTKEKAEQIVSEIKGVKSVKNSLIVKS